MNDSLLESYHSNRGFSFGGKHLVYENYPQVNEKEIDKTLSASDVYTKYKQYSKPRKYSPIYVRNKRELFQCDLISFTQNDLPQKNDGFKHLFTTIDVFSKMAWVYPIRDKKCDTVLLCFKDILQKCGKKPQKVQTDRGTEFICKTFEKYFRDEMIFHYLSYSDRKCPVIERFNLTIQQLIYKLMEYKSTSRWIDCIDQAMEIYLKRKHNTIKMSPLEAEKLKNEKEVRRNLFKFFNKNSRKKPQKQKFKIGDKVRVWKYHRTFKRGYDSNFTDEYFTIYKVLKNLPVIRYQLKDYNGDVIVGNYFQEELVLYTPSNFYKLNIIDEKGSGKNKKLLVHWEGWPDTYNQWILASDVKNFYTIGDEHLEGSESEHVSVSDPNETESEHVSVSDPIEPQDETQYGMSKNEFDVDDMTNTVNNLQKKNRNIFVGFINDMNIPQIIERKHLKNNETIINSNNSNIKKLQVKFTDDVNIPFIKGKNMKKSHKKRKNGDSTKSRKIVKVNIIDDAQIKRIQNVKRK